MYFRLKCVGMTVTLHVNAATLMSGGLKSDYHSAIHIHRRCYFPSLCLRRFTLCRCGKDRHHAVWWGHLQQYRLHGENRLQQPSARHSAHPLCHYTDTPVQQLPWAGCGQARSQLEDFSSGPAGNRKPGLLPNRKTPWQWYETIWFKKKKKFLLVCFYIFVTWYNSVNQMWQQRLQQCLKIPGVGNPLLFHPSAEAPCGFGKKTLNSSFEFI